MRSPLVLLLLLLASDGVSARTGDTTVVARVGRFTITTEELLSSFEFGPSFVRRAVHPLQKHLEYMIYECLLASEAEAAGDALTPFVQDRLEAIEEDLAVDQLYYEEVLANVRLTEGDVEAGIERSRINVRVRWLYTDDTKVRDELAEALIAGASFDSLYSLQSDSLEDPAARSLETTLLALEQDNPRFAAHLQKMRVREVSGPLPGPDGTYFFRVDEIWRNPIMTASEEVKRRVQVKKTLASIRAGILAGEHIRTMMERARPVIKAEGLNILRAYLAERGLSNRTRVSWQIPATFMTEAGPVPISRAREFIHQPVVVFGHDQLSVQDYLRWFDIRQFQLKTSSLQAFNASVRATVWKMVQDRFLSIEARRRGLHVGEGVREEMDAWFVKLLYLSARFRIMKGIAIAESEVDDRIRADAPRRGCDLRTGTSADINRAHIRAVLYQEKETAALLRTIQKTKSATSVDIREDVVETLCLTYHKKGMSINVRLFKPGGTFPRVAFPTIDEAWQRFEE